MWRTRRIFRKNIIDIRIILKRIKQHPKIERAIGKQLAYSMYGVDAYKVKPDGVSRDEVLELRKRLVSLYYHNVRDGLADKAREAFDETLAENISIFFASEDRDISQTQVDFIFNVCNRRGLDPLTDIDRNDFGRLLNFADFIYYYASKYYPDGRMDIS